MVETEIIPSHPPDSWKCLCKILYVRVLRSLGNGQTFLGLVRRTRSSGARAGAGLSIFMRIRRMTIVTRPASSCAPMRSLA